MLAYLRRVWKTDWGYVVLLFLVWRVALLLWGLLSLHLFPNPAPPIVEFNFGFWWDMWARWDGWHYIRNSLYGYSLSQPFTAFFPLYPLLIALLSGLFLLQPVVAGLIVSQLSLLGAGHFLIRLVRLDFSEPVARRSYLFLLLFPSAIFLGSVYTESTFLFLGLAAFYFARQKQWLLAGLVGFLAALTRNLGVLLVVPLLVEYGQQYKKQVRKELWAVLAPVLGLATYMLYLWFYFHDPLRFLHDQAAWYRSIDWNIFGILYEKILFFFHPWQHSFMEFFEIICVAFAGWGLYAMVKARFRLSYVLWTVCLLLPPVIQNTWSSMNRYVLVLFPLLILLAQKSNKNRSFRFLWLAIAILLLMLHTALFVNYYWAG